MFETEIDAIMNAVRARTIGEEEGIRLRDLLGAPIHPALKAYFRAEVEKDLRSEREHELRSKKFPYAHPEVVSLQRQIDTLLVQFYEFNRAEFDSLLDQAVHFEFNFLCRPQWTLLSFVMGEQRKCPVSTVEKKLEYCVDYRYFAELIRRYFADHGLTEVTYEEFRGLLERIDREVVERQSAAELARMMRALCAFVDEGRAEPQGDGVGLKLLTNAAIVYFEDKQLFEIKKQLEFERDTNARSEMGIDELAELIEWVRKGGKDQVVDIPTYIPAEETLMPVEPLPETETFAGPGGTTPEEVPDATDASGGETPAHAGAADVPGTVPVSNETPSPVVPEPSTPVIPEPPALPNIRDLISGSERRKFLKALFAGNADAFEESVDELDLLHTWEETSHFLDAMFMRLKVDPFDKVATRFTDRLYARFFPDAGGGRS